ncbi:MAG: sulfotransferase domain-containing protein, partial [Methylobacter sp.]|nr:sulfotransferase domain-containing protein [Methylobacter sp.]
ARRGLALSPFLAPYLHWMELTYNLSQAQPNTKIVLILRDPVKRVFSHWKWDVFISGKKRTSELPFLTSFPAYVDKALEVFPEYPMYTTTGFDVLQTSIYWKAASYWMECFGRENVLVLDVADYFSDSNGFLNQIYEFVGLPDFECPVSNNKINENPIVLPPPDEESMAKLSEFFKPYNEKLWPLLGKEFDWS